MNYSYRGKTLEINDARICYRNFKGLISKYNKNGKKEFSVIIPNEEIADALAKDGWNIKIKPSNMEGEKPFITLPVKVNFDGRPPAIYVKSGNNTPKKLDEESIGILDDIDIISVSLDLNPYDWDVNGKTGVSAYLDSMLVVQNVDRFGAMCADNEEAPF